MLAYEARQRQDNKGDNSALTYPACIVYIGRMNVYDFDKTIYPKDSTAEFYLWCLKRYPKCRRTLPWTAWAFFCMGTRLRTKTKSKEIFYRFLRHVPEEAPMLFWQEHVRYIRPWYYEQRRPDDLIISASPEFLLRPVSQMLEFALIASPVEQATGLYQGENCHGPEKPRRYRAVYGDAPVDGFWSDSRSDTPMAELAAHAHLVKGDVITDW